MILLEAAAATSVELAIETSEEAVSETSAGAEINTSAEASPTDFTEAATVASEGTEVSAVLAESQDGQDINRRQWDNFSIHKGHKHKEDQ